ncbi:MAG: hypothetical protein ACKVQJ_00585 [Pyrinomonadaceae bacterium]
MTELDNIWSRMLADAVAKAGDAGRRDVAEYLRLKAANDTIRTAGVEWLFDTIIEIAMRDYPVAAVERKEPHSFDRGNFTMVGSLLSIRQGVRCLTLEAGWARVPSDGIMQKGALAYARLSHFGMPKKGAEIRLVHVASLPQWLDEDGSVIDISGLRRHLDILFS